MRRLKVSMEGLLAVVTVAQEGSLDRAGRVLSLTKSALAKQIAAVEEEAGAELFDRVRGRWMLNDEGKVFVPEVDLAILHTRKGLKLVQSQVRLQAGLFFVGYCTFLAPKLINAIRQVRVGNQPDMKIEYESSLTEQTVEGVLRGSLHIGFGFLPLSEPELAVHEVFEEPLQVCLPIGHPLAVKQAIPLVALDGLPMIAVNRKRLPLQFDETDNYFRSMGIELQFVEDCFSPYEALFSVAQGKGLCLLPLSHAQSRKGVVIRPLADRFFTRKSGVFVRQDNDDESVADFLDLIRRRAEMLRKSDA